MLMMKHIHAAITNQVREINGVKYTFDENGAIKTGWMLDGNDWYYYDQNGNKCTGWVYVKINGIIKRCRCHANRMAKSSGKWYYLDESGQGYMYTGWLDLNGQWYYLNAYGSMLTGWINVKGTWYYMDAWAMHRLEANCWNLVLFTFRWKYGYWMVKR